MKNKVQYKSDSEWAGYTVSSSDKGWVVNYRSQIQGSITGLRLLISYKDSGIPRGTDLYDEYNRYFSIGEYIASAAINGQGDFVKCLRRGEIVH